MELKTGIWKDYKKTNMRKEMAFYKMLYDNCPNEILIENGLDPNNDITHWGWYYPESNYTYVEPIKKSSTNAVLRAMTNLCKAYEDRIDGEKDFPAKFYAKTCSQYCDFYSICPAALDDGWV